MKLPIRQYYHLLAKYLRPQGRRVLWMALLLLGSIALRLLNPQIMRYFIDAALGNGQLDSLLTAAALFLAVAVTGQALAVAATYFSEQVAWTATNALRVDLVAHVLHLDLSFHKQHTPGELIERIDGDVNKLANFFSRFTVNILGSLLMMIGVLVLLYREDWRVGLVLTIFALVGVVVLVRIRAFATPFWEKERAINAEFYG
ncbi:MAG: ABC transporter ATP-binding protein, partial [Caldilineaceae bacterium]|nr:ABC transporter ATP-binding protein [Caldilineaceae bacterium]